MGRYSVIFDIRGLYENLSRKSMFGYKRETMSEILH